MKKIVACLLALIGGASMGLASGCEALFAGKEQNSKYESVKIEFEQIPSGKLKDKYAKCTVVYDSYGIDYEKRAANKLVEFLKQNDGATVELLDQDDFTGGEEDQMVFYVGALDSQPSKDIAAELKDIGYAISCKEKEIVVRGSNPENTYHAVGRLMQEHLYGNPDVLTNIESGKVYEESYSTTREAYLEDISKLPLSWEYEWKAPAWMLSFEEKLATLPNKNGRAMAVAHRGDMESYPENSIEAIISAIRKGADFIEIDCELTKDGIFVLNHGSDLHATTDWFAKQGQEVNGVQLPTSSKLYDWTYEQLQQLNLRRGDGNYTDSGCKVSDFKMATLEEAIQVANGKCFLSLDRLHVYQNKEQYGIALPSELMGANNPYWPTVFELIKKHNAPQCVLYLNMGMNVEDANALRAQVEAHFGVSSPTQLDRTGSHNCIIEHFTEFDLKTDEEFDAYYTKCLSLGSYIMGNRLSKVVDWVDRHYGPNNK